MNNEATQPLPVFRTSFAQTLPVHDIMVMPRCADIDASKMPTTLLPVIK